MRKSLLLLPLVLLAGCGNNTTTINIQSANPAADNAKQQAVRNSARRMYQLMIKGDAKNFCAFLAPASIQDLHNRFPRSGMTSSQICVLISQAALGHYLKSPANREALQKSLNQVSEAEVTVQGKRALMGNAQHHTSFELVGKNWHPMMPQFGLGSSQSQDTNGSQITV